MARYGLVSVEVVRCRASAGFVSHYYIDSTLEVTPQRMQGLDTQTTTTAGGTEFLSQTYCTGWRCSGLASAAQVDSPDEWTSGPIDTLPRRCTGWRCSGLASSARVDSPDEWTSPFPLLSPLFPFLLIPRPTQLPRTTPSKDVTGNARAASNKSTLPAPCLSRDCGGTGHAIDRVELDGCTQGHYCQGRRHLLLLGSATGGFKQPQHTHTPTYTTLNSHTPTHTTLNSHTPPHTHTNIHNA
jgi:hypothetical protein